MGYDFHMGNFLALQITGNVFAKSGLRSLLFVNITKISINQKRCKVLFRPAFCEYDVELNLR